MLLVEDNADMRDYLTRLLRDQGWLVQAVGNADAALAHALASRPELILSHVMLPGRDGLALQRDIRATEPLNRVPVVLLTARAGAESAVERLRAGADDYVVKPFHPDELISRVRSHLELFRLRERVIADNEHEAVTLRGVRHRGHGGGRLHQQARTEQPTADEQARARPRLAASSGAARRTRCPPGRP